MKTVGQIIKDYRLRKKYTLGYLEKVTKIKRIFLEAIEKENWKSLPEYPVVVGFVRSISSVLGVDQTQILAFLRRDYPPQNLLLNPKPDIRSKFLWSPITSIWMGLIIAFLSVVGYLTFQYLRFSTPPRLEVLSPVEEQVVKGSDLLIQGKTSEGSIATANNQPAYVEDNGEFETVLEVSSSTVKIEIKAVSKAGKETVIIRKIIVKEN